MAATSNLSKAKQKFRYIANTSTREFHSIRRQKPQCQVSEIKDATYYKTGRAAIADSMDACSFCSVYWKSRDNK
jgi:hypothetical protein